MTGVTRATPVTTGSGVFREVLLCERAQLHQPRVVNAQEGKIQRCWRYGQRAPEIRNQQLFWQISGLREAGKGPVPETGTDAGNSRLMV